MIKNKFLTKWGMMFFFSSCSLIAEAQTSSGNEGEPIIIDNRDANTAQEGVFGTSGARNHYGPDSIFAYDRSSGSAKFSFFPDIPVEGKARIEVRWTSLASRADRATYTVETADGTETLTVNQQRNGGEWVELGVFTLKTGTTEISLTNSGTGSNIENGNISADAVRITPIEDNPPSLAVVQAQITSSRTECASPCTVVFSAEKTTAEGLDDHGVWSQLAYHWDFGTNEQGANNNYLYTDGVRSRETGHVPMVTKTFLCETGVCTYNVGMRAQNEAGQFGDDFVTITVMSESEAWAASDTVCISNTLDVSADWTDFDKACPAGAVKQSVMLDYDQYDGKLVLFKNGDMFTHSNNSNPNRLPIVIATLMGQSDFKLGVFGDEVEAKPYINGLISLSKTRFSGPRNAPSAANLLRLNDSVITQLGQTENVTIEGLKVKGVDFPMTFQHVGVHDLDMDGSDNTTTGAGGRIGIAEGSTICHHSSDLNCANVPFPKGGYISSVDLVGGGEEGPGLNLGQTACAMVNFFGITDTRMRRADEHNLRLAGWYRTNIMRTFFRGQHLQEVNDGKNLKITLRNCNRSGGEWERGVWFNDPHRPINWNRDVMNDDGTMRTRADADNTSIDPNDIGFGEHVHQSRYQVIAHNRIGDSTVQSPEPDGLLYFTNVSRNFPEDLLLYKDVILSHNTWEKKDGSRPVGQAGIIAAYATCVGNSDPEVCAPSFVPPEMLNYRNNPVPVAVPLAPGS